MGWIVVPCLLEGRDQMNHRFPNRDHGADGTIGDTAHQSHASSHNPDITGDPEYRDHDSLDEVRAIDFDKDLRDVHGVTMEQVVQRWITKARAGQMPFVRYFIYNKRIWHRRDNFTTRAYTGSNQHTDHAHVNSDFNQAADTAHGTNWFVSDLGLPTPKPPSPSPSPSMTVLKQGSTGDAVRHVQQFLKDVFPAYRQWVPVKRGQMIAVDGDFGPQTKAWVEEFQARAEIHIDGEVGPETLGKMRHFGYKY